MQDLLCGQLGYQLARGLAATGTARIVVAPTAFWTQGYQPLERLVTPDQRASTAEDRAEIWQIIAGIAAEDGITMIAQPDETVIDGVFTSPEWAIGGYQGVGDFEHRSTAYGALILNRALALLRPG